MAQVVLEQVWKIYPGRVTAVKDFNLAVRARELIVIVGPSGCGKSAGAASASARAWSMTCRPRIAISPWSFRTMPSIRI